MLKEHDLKEVSILKHVEHNLSLNDKSVQEKIDMLNVVEHMKIITLGNLR